MTPAVVVSPIVEVEGSKDVVSVAVVVCSVVSAWVVVFASVLVSVAVEVSVCSVSVRVLVLPCVVLKRLVVGSAVVVSMPVVVLKVLPVVDVSITVLVVLGTVSVMVDVEAGAVDVSVAVAVETIIHIRYSFGLIIYGQLYKRFLHLNINQKTKWVLLLPDVSPTVEVVKVLICVVSSPVVDSVSVLVVAGLEVLGSNVVVIAENKLPGHK